MLFIVLTINKSSDSSLSLSLSARLLSLHAALHAGTCSSSWRRLALRSAAPRAAADLITHNAPGSALRLDVCSPKQRFSFKQTAAEDGGVRHGARIGEQQTSRRSGQIFMEGVFVRRRWKPVSFRLCSFIWRGICVVFV